MVYLLEWWFCMVNGGFWWSFEHRPPHGCHSVASVAMSRSGHQSCGMGTGHRVHPKLVGLRWMEEIPITSWWFIMVYPIILRGSTIQDGAGFLPSTVCWPSKSSLLRTIRVLVLGFCFLLVLTKHVPLPLFALFVWCLAAGVEIVQTKDKLRLTVSWNHG